MSLPAMTKTKFLGLLPLLLVVLLGTALRVIDIAQESLWLDETFSVFMSRYDVGQMFEATSQDNHPPLYYLALKATTGIFGESAFTIRLLSLVFGVGAIVLTYLIGKRLFSKGVGLIASFFVALSPLLIWYSQEARSYSLIVFFALLSFLSLHEAVVLRKWKYWFVFSVSVAILFWTHYFSVFFVLLEIAAFFLWWKKDRALFRQGIIAGIGVFILYLPWIFIMWGKEGNPYGLAWAVTSEHTLKNTLLTFIGGYPDLWLTAQRSFTLLESLVSLIILASILAGTWLAYQRKEWKNYAIVILLAFVPCLLAYIITNSWRPMYHVRFFLYSVPFFFLAFSYTLGNMISFVPETYRKKGERFVIFAAVGIGALVSALMLTTWTQMHAAVDKEGWNTLVPYLMSQARDGDIVVSDPPYHQIPLSYALGEDTFRERYFIADNADKNVQFYGYLYFYGQDIQKQMEPLMKQSDRIWLVTEHGPAAQVNVSTVLETSFVEVERKRFPKVLELVLYEKRT